MATKQPDWEAIESAYRAGSLSVRSIAERHEVSHVAIAKKAKKEGWQRDLSDKVRKAVKAKVTGAVTTDGYQSKVVTEEQIIEDASNEGAAVVLAHRAGLAKWRAIADKLSTALTDLPVVAENLGDFSRALNAGVDAQLKVIKGERQAYNLDTEEGDKTVSGLSDLMDELSKDA
jgi:hypothetical protein